MPTVGTSNSSRRISAFAIFARFVEIGIWQKLNTRDRRNADGIERFVTIKDFEKGDRRRCWKEGIDFAKGHEVWMFLLGE
jgi:hypothetical protein